LPYWHSQWPQWSEQEVEEMREQFCAMDLNGDGTVDAEEL
jgi:Ca2+-binding EF-hand superfamily protein